MPESSKFYEPPDFSAISPSWRELIGPEQVRSDSRGYPDRSFLESDYDKIKKAIFDLCQPEDSVFPSRHKVFRAFDFFPPQHTRVVILGQDPYFTRDRHSTRGYADGLAYSVDPVLGQCPASLNAILTKAHYECEKSNDANVGTSLAPWAEQKVLLLN